MAPARATARRAPLARPDRRSSNRGTLLTTIRTRRWADRLGDVRPFRLGVGALSEFPVKIWARLSRRYWSHLDVAAIDYDEVAGYAPLRTAIAAYLQSARGVACEASQVIIVNGSQQALDLASRVLLDPGDVVWCEDPGYDGARGAFLGAGARVVPVPVDRNGLNVAYATRRHPGARLAYVTPSHQFPSGVTMSLGRRLELLRWARRSSAWIFEDDYDSEFRYSLRPLPALQGLDADGCVIYSGSFSKVLFPALRLGYLVVPPSILDTFLRARFLADVHPSTITQAILAEFIDGGHFERHVRRMRTLYRERQEALVSAASLHLAELLQVQAARGGMHLTGWLPPGVDDRLATRAARAEGVVVAPLSFFAQVRRRRGALLLGYAGLSPEQIASGTKRLAKALETLARKSVDSPRTHFHDRSQKTCRKNEEGSAP
ncbi:MAG TPA: PLP-dependent aminotransferase family protein [Vicinamibacterales bacterium]|nr:PLP-dependent aminotransferase family protein [Vicinamibacterales bacterium]